MAAFFSSEHGCSENCGGLVASSSPVVLKPDGETITVNGVVQLLNSGMTVAVELKAGARRLLEYLFSPLVEIASKAMRER
jgi:hemolysin D